MMVSPREICVNEPDLAPRLLQRAVENLSHGRQVALLTLVNIDGSAPFPIGTQMLVLEDGGYYGQLSGGCVEPALAEIALKQIKAQQNHVFRFGAGSPFFDIQLPCGSAIDVHFEVSTPLATYRERIQNLDDRQSIEYRIEGDNFVHSQQYLPCIRIHVFGDGAIPIAIAKIANHVGFEAMVWSNNPRQHEALKEAGIASMPLKDETDLQYFDEYSAVACVYHEHHRETTILMQALASKSFYVGAMGSQRTHRLRKQELLGKGLDEEVIDQIKSPIGLAIRAQTPEQIALAIVAEISALSPRAKCMRT